MERYECIPSQSGAVEPTSARRFQVHIHLAIDLWRVDGNYNPSVLDNCHLYPSLIPQPASWRRCHIRGATPTFTCKLLALLSLASLHDLGHGQSYYQADFCWPE